MHTVAVVAFEGVAAFELGVACEVFGIDRRDTGGPAYRLLVCAATPPPIRTNVGFSIDTPYRLRHLARADTVIVPAAWPVHARPPEDLLKALRRAHRRGARIASVCSGAFILAEAGLLDGKRATTHWMHTAELTARYPAITVEPNVLYVDEGSVLTSAGTAAGIDLCLHMVRQDYGAAAANVVARRMVVPPHRDGGQAQYISAPLPPTPDDDRLSGTLDWAVAHLDEPLTVECLAVHARLSPRTFARRFREVTGTTPLKWLLHQRVVTAQRLLETTLHPIERVAEHCGFGSAANFRTHFGRAVGTSPAAYRRAFALR